MTISSSEVVQVKDRYLATNSNERFFLKGIAFPDSPPEQTTDEIPHIQYNATGWIAVLQQLRDALPPQALNTIRLYQLDADVDYSQFFEAAARLDFYILVPLTANVGGAILNRLAVPPKCYTPKLLAYGQRIVEMSLQHPNILAGVIGNEVMNDLESWHAAPCIKAYARDLKLYMKALQQQTSSSSKLQKLYQNRLSSDTQLLPPLPLLYAAQDSGIGAALSDVDVVRLTVDYLSCTPQDNDDDFGIDVLGVNVESWCATRDTFEYNDDGTVGTFYQLWQGLHANVGIPLVFSELGCSHSRYNKDTPELRTPEGTRDWTEVPVVLEDMQDTWSGFCAYAYWGNSLFNMMTGGPWNGNDVLEPTQDFDNFQQQCLLARTDDATTIHINEDPHVAAGSLHDLPLQNGGVMEQYYQMLQQSDQPPTCDQVEEVLQKTAKLNLHPLGDLPSYFGQKRVELWVWLVLVAVSVVALVGAKRYGSCRKRESYEGVPDA